MKSTKNLLGRSAFDLSETKYFESVSVKDIASHAQVERQTFYYYFSDKYQCLTFYLQQWGKLLAERDGSTNLQQHLLNLLDVIRKHKEAIIHITYGDQGYSLLSSFLDTALNEFILQSEGKKKTDTLDKGAQFFAYGVHGIIIEWIKKGMDDEPSILLLKTFPSSTESVDRLFSEL